MAEVTKNDRTGEAATPPNPVMAAPRESSRFFTRLALALRRPEWALAIATDPANAGRASNDAMLLFGLLVLCGSFSAVVGAVWLGTVAGGGVGSRALFSVISNAVMLPLGFVAVAALVLTLAAGKARSVSRAFDAACVAVIPFVMVQFVTSTFVHVAGVALPNGLRWTFSGIAFGWAGALAALALRPLRIAHPVRAIAPAAVMTAMRPARNAVVVLFAAAIVGHSVWIVNHLDYMRPMREGDAAPAFALPEVDATGRLQGSWQLAAAAGKPVVLDFWATWCGPCREAMPGLVRLANEFAGRAEFIGVNIDDPARARAMFTQLQAPMRLLFDNAGVADRFGVHAIPHVVVIDAQGRVREVLRGGASEERLRNVLLRLQ